MASILQGPLSKDVPDGLLQWSNSIRLNMSNDSGRQLFQQQVQTHGFLFLDDYLDNILSGAKQDPLIELVKTPGRRKAIAKKPKLASKLGIPISFNLAPTTNQSDPPSRDPVQSSSFQPVETSVPVSQKKTPTESKSQKDADIPTMPLSLHVPTHLENNDLSIIAEDDENDNRASVDSHMEVISSQLGPTQDEEESNAVTSPILPDSQASGPEPIKHDTSFQSLPPSEYHSAQATPISSTFPSQSLLSEASGGEPKSPKEESIHRAQSPVVSTQPRDDSPVIDMQVPLKDEDTTSKSNIVAIPSLPEPTPFRKSRSARDPSVGASTFTSATPSAKRPSSWLMKAREVKALDANARAISSGQSAFSAVPQSNSKRKSGDVNDGQAASNSLDTQERKAKATKNRESDVAPLKSSPDAQEGPAQSTLKPEPEPLSFMPSPQGVLDRLKRTVEGLGVRVGMTAKDSEEFTVANTHTFAEAKAAAKARIAERNKEDGITTPEVPAASKSSKDEMEIDAQHASTSSRVPEAARLSMSDLFPSGSRIKEKHKAPGKPFTFAIKSPQSKASARESTSTTPPNSPPPIVATSSSTSAVFSKPSPVFVPREPISALTRPLPSPPAKEYGFQPARPVFTAQPVGLGLASSSQYTAFKPPAPLTAQSTMESIRSDIVFDKFGGETPAWMPNTQDTDYTYDSRSQGEQAMEICDEDDSWPVDEKLAAGVQWTFGNPVGKEDSMTWSTLPSQSQRADTGPLAKSATKGSSQESQEESHGIPGAFDVEMPEDNDLEEDERGDEDELEDIVLNGGKSNAGTKSVRPPSQLSMTSSSSSQSQGGFLNQASKLFSSALGTNKKKPEVKKVMQLAAVAAKKQQEEADKKASRLKEMEVRRQIAQQRKAEEEKAKLLEEERKMKDEMDRRKREREEMTDKRPIKVAPAKKEEEVPKLRKAEPEKKSALKKAASGTLGKSQLKPALKATSSYSSFATPSNSQTQLASSSKPAADGSKLPKATVGSLKGKAKAAPPPIEEDEVSHPSQYLQGQMASRAIAQMKAAKQTEPAIPSEAIELPDINSEYSDSDDEDRKRTFDPPDWAQSPELKTALELQSTINPDDIFGAVRPLRMEEIFRTRTSRFRARTSSANWTGTDMLTLQEERDYAKRMGFK